MKWSRIFIYISDRSKSYIKVISFTINRNIFVTTYQYLELITIYVKFRDTNAKNILHLRK